MLLSKLILLLKLRIGSMNQFIRFVVLFVVVSMVLFLGVWLFVKSWAGSLQNISFEGLRSSGPILQTDVLKEIGVGEKKEFVSTDGKLRVPYPAGWIEFPQEQLSSVFPIEETATPLFLLQKIGSGSVAQFFGAEIKTQTETFDEFLKTFSQDAKERGWNTQIVSAEPDELGGTFESRYSAGGIAIFRSKERVIVGKEKVYLFSFFTQETNWASVSGQATSVLSSLQYTKQ